MTYAFLRFLYGLWVMGLIGFLLLAVATTMFSARRWRKRLRIFWRRATHAFIWPIALFSAAGRKALFTDITEDQT